MGDGRFTRMCRLIETGTDRAMTHLVFEDEYGILHTLSFRDVRELLREVRDASRSVIDEQQRTIMALLSKEDTQP